jgi:hypothetical protein
MIKANELRIGNLVNYEQTTHLITCVNIDYTISIWVDKKNQEHLYTHQNNELKPIPLTEEWLLKFGFGEELKDEWKILVNGCWSFFICYYENQYNHWVGCGAEYCHGKEIKYVHQLQNLYFALTNEELKIKEYE